MEAIKEKQPRWFANYIKEVTLGTIVILVIVSLQIAMELFGMFLQTLLK